MRARVPTPRESKISELKHDSQHLPRPYKLRRYYTPAEVAKHNLANDCWVSKFNKVFDLTLLLHTNNGKPECDPIVLASGTDITHWFDSVTENVSVNLAFELSVNVYVISQKHLLTQRLAFNKRSALTDGTCMCRQ